jgi:hypothetical protein
VIEGKRKIKKCLCDSPRLYSGFSDVLMLNCKPSDIRKGFRHARRKAFVDPDSRGVGTQSIAACCVGTYGGKLGDRIELRCRDRNDIRKGARFCPSRHVCFQRHSKWRAHKWRTALYAPRKTCALKEHPKLSHLWLCQPSGAQGLPSTKDSVNGRPASGDACEETPLPSRVPDAQDQRLSKS